MSAGTFVSRRTGRVTLIRAGRPVHRTGDSTEGAVRERRRVNDPGETGVQGFT